MFAPLIHQGGDGPAHDGIHAAADKGISGRGKIGHWPREIQFALEPGLNRVLVRGAHIEQMFARHCADVTGVFPEPRRSVRPAQPWRTRLCGVLFVTSNGVSVLQLGFVRSSRRLPENVFPPLFVIAFTTPPENRPYSALMPDVSV